MKPRQYDSTMTIVRYSIVFSSSYCRDFTIVVSLFRIIVIVPSSIVFQINTFKGDGPNGIPYPGVSAFDLNFNTFILTNSQPCWIKSYWRFQDMCKSEVSKRETSFACTMFDSLEPRLDYDV